MPPHARMSAVQMLLLRALVARFWQEPYRRQAGSLGDRAARPLAAAAFRHCRHPRRCRASSARSATTSRGEWFAPFIEFRFPRFGTVNCDGVTIELRQAIEPWHVLGEEVSGTGTARYVDSSVERMQVKVDGMIDGRHAVTCNGRTLAADTERHSRANTSPACGSVRGARHRRCIRRSASRRR